MLKYISISVIFPCYFEPRTNRLKSLLYTVNNQTLFLSIACSAHYGNIAMTTRNSATVDIQSSKIITRYNVYLYISLSVKLAVYANLEAFSAMWGANSLKTFSGLDLTMVCPTLMSNLASLLLMLYWRLHRPTHSDETNLQYDRSDSHHGRR